MLEILGMAAAAAAAVFGHTRSRSFVRDRLRYTDWVDRPFVGVAAGVGAVALASPVVWVLPAVGSGAALLFGAGVGTGVSLGARDCRRLNRGG